MRTVVNLLVGATIAAALPAPAHAICRLVEEPDSVPPSVDPKQSVLFVKHDDLSIGCDEGDAGIGDAGIADAGAADAGAADGGLSDGGTPDASGPNCEYIGEAISMTVQPRLTIGEEGARFAMLMVTPELPFIQLAPIDLFTRLAEATEPTVIGDPVYVEDEALGYQCKDPQGAGCASGSYSSGGGGNFPPPGDPSWDDPDAREIETIGPYEVVRLDVTSRAELAGWLDSLAYVYDENDLDAVEPYLDLGFVVTAVRVRTDVQFIGGLQPLRFTYPGTEIRMPLGISRQTEPAETHIAAYIIADGRYDFPGATPFYAGPHPLEPDLFITRASLQRSLMLGADDDPIAQRIFGDPSFKETVYVDQIVRIPSSKCPDGEPRNTDYALCACDGGNSPSAGGFALFALTCLGMTWVMRRRRRADTLPR